MIFWRAMDKPNTDLPVAYDDVAAAAQALQGIAVRTPLLESRALNERAGSAA